MSDIDKQPKWFIYPFFLVHMLMFGGSGLLMAYSENARRYCSCSRMAALGLFGIYAQIGWILELFGKDIGDYPWYRHITPFLYYVLVSLLLYGTLCWTER